MTFFKYFLGNDFRELKSDNALKTKNDVRYEEQDGGI